MLQALLTPAALLYARLRPCYGSSPIRHRPSPRRRVADEGSARLHRPRIRGTSSRA